MTDTQATAPERVHALKLVASVGDGEHTACIMSAVAVLDGRGPTDDHPSAVLRELGIRINDGPWWRDDAERTATLLPIVESGILCAAAVHVTPELEQRRRDEMRRWAFSFVVPRALRSAASALRSRKRVDLDEHAVALERHASELAAGSGDLAEAQASARAARDAAAYAAAAAAADAAYVAAAYAAYADVEKAREGARRAERVVLRDSLIDLLKRIAVMREGDAT